MYLKFVHQVRHWLRLVRRVTYEELIASPFNLRGVLETTYGLWELDTRQHYQMFTGC
jgi:hypothetical protein